MAGSAGVAGSDDRPLAEALHHSSGPSTKKVLERREGTEHSTSGDAAGSPDGTRATVGRRSLVLWLRVCFLRRPCPSWPGKVSTSPHSAFSGRGWRRRRTRRRRRRRSAVLLERARLHKKEEKEEEEEDSQNFFLTFLGRVRRRQSIMCLDRHAGSVLQTLSLSWAAWTRRCCGRARCYAGIAGCGIPRVMFPSVVVRPKMHHQIPPVAPVQGGRSPCCLDVQIL